MFKGYHKTDNNYDSHSKQGAGVFYREEFNTLNELWGSFLEENRNKTIWLLALDIKI